MMEDISARVSMEQQPSRILFICLGNICRSPLAEGVFRAVLEETGHAGRFEIDSAGTGGWHAGAAPDPRSIEIAARHGVDISAQRARRVVAGDFARFDLILGMDASNVADLRRMAGAHRSSIHGFIDFATSVHRDVPDPYYGGADGFLAVYRMIREASEALSARLARPVSTPGSGQVSSTM